MRHHLALLALTAPLLAACDTPVGLQDCDLTFRTADASEVVVDLLMPTQELVVDEVGNHAEAEEVAVRLDEPRLVLTDGTEVAPDRWEDRPLILRDNCDDRVQPWARWSDLPAPPARLRVRLTPRSSSSDGVRKLLPGASVAIAATYQAILADSAQRHGAVVLNLPAERQVTVESPASPSGSDTSSTAGRAWQLVLDPQRWLLDEDANRLMPIEVLSEDAIAPIDDEATQQIVDEIVSEMTLEAR